MFAFCLVLNAPIGRKIRRKKKLLKFFSFVFSVAFCYARLVLVKKCASEMTSLYVPSLIVFALCLACIFAFVLLKASKEKEKENKYANWFKRH